MGITAAIGAGLALSKTIWNKSGGAGVGSAVAFGSDFPQAAGVLLHRLAEARMPGVFPEAEFVLVIGTAVAALIGVICSLFKVTIQDRVERGNIKR